LKKRTADYERHSARRSEETVAFARRPLRYFAARQFPGEEITETFKKLLRQLEMDCPSNRPLASAVVTVWLVTDSADQVINSHFIDRGGYVAFGKGPNALKVTSSHDSFGNTMAAHEVRYHAVFQMAADDKLS
jgi:hypothetical protein